MGDEDVPLRYYFVPAANLRDAHVLPNCGCMHRTYSIHIHVHDARVPDRTRRLHVSERYAWRRLSSSSSGQLSLGSRSFPFGATAFSHSRPMSFFPRSSSRYPRLFVSSAHDLCMYMYMYMYIQLYEIDDVRAVSSGRLNKKLDASLLILPGVDAGLNLQYFCRRVPGRSGRGPAFYRRYPFPELRVGKAQCNALPWPLRRASRRSTTRSKRNNSVQ